MGEGSICGVSRYHHPLWESFTFIECHQYLNYGWHNVSLAVFILTLHQLCLEDEWQFFPHTPPFSTLNSFLSVITLFSYVCYSVPPQPKNEKQKKKKNPLVVHTNFADGGSLFFAFFYFAQFGSQGFYIILFYINKRPLLFFLGGGLILLNFRLYLRIIFLSNSCDRELLWRFFCFTPSPLFLMWVT